MGTIRGELFTQQVNLDNRSYFFNVKENRNNDIFLQIVESKIKDGEDDRRAIVVFSEDMQKFCKGLEDSLAYIEKEEKDRKKQKAEKKAAKDAKYSKSADTSGAKKKVLRRKGESRLVAEKRAEREAEKEVDGIKRSGKVLHVVSKRNNSKVEEF